MKCVPYLLMMIIAVVSTVGQVQASSVVINNQVKVQSNAHANTQAIEQAKEQAFWDKEPIPLAKLSYAYAMKKKGRLSLQMGLYTDYRTAKVDVEVLAAQGFPVDIIKVADNKGQLFFILAHGDYSDVVKANEAKQRAQSILFRNIQLILSPKSIEPSLK